MMRPLVSLFTAAALIGSLAAVSAGAGAAEIVTTGTVSSTVQVTVSEDALVEDGDSDGTVECSAYCWTGNATSSGEWPTPDRTIAVSKEYITDGTYEYGDQILIQMSDGTYVLYTVEDTGNLSKYGRTFDIYFDTEEEATEFGVSELKAWTVDPDLEEGDAGTITVTATYTESRGEVEEEEIVDYDSFPDLDEDSWYYEGVSYVIENGIMNGTGDGLFSPDTATSRSMLVTILYRLEGSPELELEESSFSDVVSGSWYEDAVIWAEQTGVAMGYDTGEFGVSDSVTREQLATFFYRYASLCGYDTSDSTDLSTYPDWEEVGSWAEEALSWAVGAGLIQGTESGGVVYLSPKNECTRAMTATILYRFATNMEEAETEDEEEEAGEEESEDSGEQIQTLEDYAGSLLTYEGTGSDEDSVSWEFSGSSDDFDVVSAYVELLKGGSMNLELTDSYEAFYDSGVGFFSYGFTWTGSGEVDGSVDVVFLEDEECDLCVWGVITGGDMTVTVTASRSLEFADLGLRYGE